MMPSIITGTGCFAFAGVKESSPDGPSDASTISECAVFVAATDHVTRGRAGDNQEDEA